MSGSLHLAAQCLVGPSSGSTLFGGSAAATLAVRFQVNSNTVSNNQTIVGWGTNATSGLPLFYYSPTTGNLIFTAYGGPGGGYPADTFAVTLPLQLGVGYHFLLSWGSTPLLYLNGILYATSTLSAVLTYPYKQVLVGGNGGSTYALDLDVEDLAIWNSYTATAADAMALANRTSTPLQIGTCSAWWTLGGGTIGDTPSISDAAFTDQTGNSNTLAVQSGSFTGATYAAPIGVDSPATIAALISESGTLAIFGTTSSYTPPGAPFPTVALLERVNFAPTIYRGGTPVQIGPATWFNSSLDTPIVGYQLQCGSASAIAVEASGGNYTAPTIAVSGGGGSGLVLGTPVLKLGVSGYTIINGGSGLNQPPTVTVTDAGGGTGAVMYAVILGGHVSKLVIVDGGSGYVNPVITIAAPVSGNTSTATAIVTGGVITGYTFILRGSGYGTALAVSVAPPNNNGGPLGNLTAQAYAVAYGSDGGALAGTLRAIFPATGGVLGGGQGYSTTRLPTVSIGTGVGAQLDYVLSGGQITAITVRYLFQGSGYPATVQLNISDPTGSGAAATLTISGGTAASVTVSATGNNYTSPSFTIAPVGSTLSIRPVVSNYIAAVPVVTPGDYLSPPTLTVSDATGSGAILRPLMDGASPGDVFTYSAPNSWLTPRINSLPMGGVQAATNVAIDNWTGQREGVSGGLGAFAQTPTMLAGFNIGEQPTNTGAVNFTAKNRMRQGTTWQVSTGSGVLTNSGGTPVSWTLPASTIIRKSFYSPGGQNQIDNAGWPNQVGQWTLEYDDANAGTSTATAVWMGTSSNLAAQTTVVPVSLSGPNTGTTTGAAVNSADIHYTYGGGITSIGVAHSTLGTGYQAAIVVITGGGGLNAVATATVVGGAITGFTIVCPGTNFSSTPTVLVYGAQVSGTAVTAIYSVGYSSANPPSWSTGLNVFAAAASGTWTIGNVWAVGPDAFTGNAVASIDRTFALATDDSMIEALTGPDNQVPGTLRFMDVTQPYGGISNFIFSSDLMNASAESWQTQRTLSANFRYVRFLNTDPGSATYSWSSPRVYGPQALFNAGPDSFGTYIELPTTDNGWFINNNYGSQGWVVMEFRSETPHGFTTGQLLYFVSYANIPFTNIGNFQLGNQAAAIIWVTGEYTIGASFYAAGSAPSQANAQTVNSTVEIDLSASGGVAASMTVPRNAACVPYEYSAAMASQFPGSICWVNLPHFGTDGLYTAIAQKIAANIGSTNLVYLEYGNENWNGAFAYYPTYWSMGALVGYIPEGDVVFGFYTSPGVKPAYDAYGPATLLAGNAQNVFKTTWIAAGQDPSRLRMLQGSWYNGSYRTQQIIEATQQWGIPVDYIPVAPYYSIPSDLPVLTAFSPAGSIVGGAGSWPMGAINDFCRHWFTYNTNNQLIWGQHAEYCSFAGQPVAPAGLVDTVHTGGALSAGNYYVCYTFVDAESRETTIGLSRSISTSIAAGDIPALVMPAWPSWAAAMNIYLTQANAPPGTEVFYLNVLLASYQSTYPPGSHVPLSIAIPAPGTQQPPTTNNAAPNVEIPEVITYEGGIQTGIPNGVPFGPQLQLDSLAHPSARNLIYGWYASCQLGDQSMPNGGAVAATYYQLYTYPVYPYTWNMAPGTMQPPGDGSANNFATFQAGWPGDGHDHTGGPAVANTAGIALARNTSPAMQGLVDWISGTSSTPPTVTATVPVSGAVNVSTTAPLTVTYSAAMLSGSLTLEVSAEDIEPLPCILTSYDGDTDTATFAAPDFDGEIEYTGSADGESLSGTSMAAPYTWTFTTGDSTPHPPALVKGPSQYGRAPFGAPGFAFGFPGPSAIQPPPDPPALVRGPSRYGRAPFGAPSFAFGYPGIHSIVPPPHPPALVRGPSQFGRAPFGAPGFAFGFPGGPPILPLISFADPTQAIVIG